MLNITAKIQPKKKWFDSIRYNIDIIIFYYGNPLEFRIQYDEIHYAEPEKYESHNELHWIATPEIHVCEEHGPPEKSFKNAMLEYFRYDYFVNDKGEHSHSIRKLTKEQQQEISKEIDEMWMIIKTELDRNNIPIPNWYFD